MSLDDNAKNAIKSVSNLWLDFSEKQYEERWWDGLGLILGRSTLPSMNEELAYKAGLIWVALYEIYGAMGAKDIKNVEFVPYFCSAIASRYGLDKTKLWGIFAEIPGTNPEGRYLDVYCLQDAKYSAGKENGQDVKQAFLVFSNKVMETNNLGNVMNVGTDLSRK